MLNDKESLEVIAQFSKKMEFDMLAELKEGLKEARQHV